MFLVEVITKLILELQKKQLMVKKFVKKGPATHSVCSIKNLEENIVKSSKRPVFRISHVLERVTS
jgi:hypothetical protein